MKSCLSAASHSPRLYDREPRRELFAESIYDIERRGSHWSARGCGKAEENHSRAAKPFRIDKLAKVRVFGEQYSSVVAREFQNLVVANPRGNFRHSQDIVGGRSKSPHHGKVATFIGDKPHFLRLCVALGGGEQNDFFVRYCVGCVSDRCADVFTREPRIAV
jgi:hypothetical protein